MTSQASLITKDFLPQKAQDFQLLLLAATSGVQWENLLKDILFKQLLVSSLEDIFTYFLIHASTLQNSSSTLIALLDDLVASLASLASISPNSPFISRIRDQIKLANTH